MMTTSTINPALYALNNSVIIVNVAQRKRKKNIIKRRRRKKNNNIQTIINIKHKILFFYRCLMLNFASGRDHAIKLSVNSNGLAPLLTNIVHLIWSTQVLIQLIFL